MKMYICVFAILWSVVVNAQNKTCYKFTVAEKRYVDSAKLFYPGMENEFRYCRDAIRSLENKDYFQKIHCEHHLHLKSQIITGLC